MNKICTTIEQSQKLIELGIDVNTADMCYRIVAYNPDDIHVYQPYCFAGTLESDIPAWSLSALLDLMPNVKGHYPELCRGKQTGQYYMWIENTFDTQMFDNPIDAAIEMIVWLKENNKI